MIRTRILIIFAGLGAILLAYGAVFVFLTLDDDNASLRAAQTALADTDAALQETRVALAELNNDRVALSEMNNRLLSRSKLLGSTGMDQPFVW